jgi:hypothetical protein
MQLERVLETIAKERQKLRITFETEQMIFSGIDALDELLCGFKLGKSYTFVARQNNGMTAFIKTITDNINLLYQWNEAPVLKLSYSPNRISYDKRINKKPLFIIIEIEDLDQSKLEHLKTKIQNFEKGKTVIILIHKLKNTLEKPIPINEIPNALLAYSDITISLFRPEHYNIAHWNDGTSTKQQLECILLQSENTESKRIKLCIDDKQNRVQSCYDHSPFLHKLTTRIKAYLDE